MTPGHAIGQTCSLRIIQWLFCETGPVLCLALSRMIPESPARLSVSSLQATGGQMGQIIDS